MTIYGQRYEQLLRAVRDKQPQAILEVGTWSGNTALNMLSLSSKSRYYGFDLFEDGTKENDALEFNTKAHQRMDDVYEKLTGYDVHLYKGNTRETLATFDEKVDFVWIDGGHSVETIRSDWENVKRCLMPHAWVFFDDYYTDGVDIKRMGCNLVVEKLRHEVLPIKDPVKGGGNTQMVRVWAD